ncbi:MAG: DUF2064 domain-containing protein [Candidatus Heimdallarchaeota archaeon]
MSIKQGIILFTKVPTQVPVKTRLAHPQFPENFQVDLTTAMIKDTLLILNEVMKHTIFTPIINYFPENDSARNMIKKIIIAIMEDENPSLMEKANLVPQVGDTMGQRFSIALNRAFRDLKMKSTIIIGSDTPHLSSSYILRGMEFLMSNAKGIVLGPSQNGGFYLFGTNQPCPGEISEIFQKNSIHNELGNLLELFPYHKVCILPTVFDIDTFSDLRNIFSEVYARSFNTPKKPEKKIAVHTYSLLKTLDGSIWESSQDSGTMS